MSVIIHGRGGTDLTWAKVRSPGRIVYNSGGPESLRQHFLKAANSAAYQVCQLLFRFSCRQTNFHSSSPVLILSMTSFLSCVNLFFEFRMRQILMKRESLFSSNDVADLEGKRLCWIIKLQTLFELFTNCSALNTICKSTEEITKEKPNHLMLFLCFKFGHQTASVLCLIVMILDRLNTSG